jgi:carbonic anhydrase
MHKLTDLLVNNRLWAKQVTTRDPHFFARLAQQQSPNYLWIGCSDSRVPANQIVGLLPGEMFVHRNVGNIVAKSDLNCLCVLHFAIEVLKVKHIIVCGHYGCAGVFAALRPLPSGAIGDWLCYIKNVQIKHRRHLERYSIEAERHNRLCELNVIEQVANVCRTTAVREGWRRGQNITVHGWIYDIRDGLLRDLETSADSEDEFLKRYDAVVNA